MALWLDFEQLSSYSLCRAFWSTGVILWSLSASFSSCDIKMVWKCYMKFDTIIQLLIHLSAYFWICGMKILYGIWYKLEDWTKRYLIQTYHISSLIRVALWLVFKWLSSYLFVYWLLFVFKAKKYYLEFQSKLKDWIKRYLIVTWHRFKHQSISSHIE